MSCLAITSAPASADPPPSAVAGEAAPAASDGPIRIRNVNGYAVLDRQHLVLRAGASRRYLVTLQRRCSGLRSGMHLGLSLGRFSTIHNPRFEYVETRDDRCYFDTIEQVESNDEARTLIAARADAAAAAETAGSGTR
ncbi:hypothetical protein AWH62_10010 [Maricaulis sp. W15]|nr:hypothetical protein AWH62_10010 [Maricaulis sp. W15]